MGKSNSSNVTAIVRTVINVCINIILIVIIINLTITYSGKAFEFGKAVFDEQPVDKEYNAVSKVITIKENYGGREIAEMLQKNGLIENKYVFLIQYELSDYKDEIVPGTYTVSTSMTASQIMEVCTQKAVSEDTETK